MSQINPYHPSFPLSARLRRAYAKMVERFWNDDDHQIYLVTITCNQIAGPDAVKIKTLLAESDHFYRALLLNCVRNPRSPAQKMYVPVMLGHPDLPVRKNSKPDPVDGTINGGLHMHFIVIIRLGSRLRVDLDEHVYRNKAIYMGTSGVKQDIHVEQIYRTPEKATEYVFKFLGREDFGCEFVFIRPKTLSELSAKGILPRPAPGPKSYCGPNP